MDLTTFTKDDVRQHLTELGYKNIPDDKLESFLKDLRRLIKHEQKKNRIDQKLTRLEQNEANLLNTNNSNLPNAREVNLPNTSSSLDSASKLKQSPRKIRRVKRPSESHEKKPVVKKPPKVTIALDEDSFGASYEESGSRSSRSSSSSKSSSKTSSSSSSNSRSRSLEERDTIDNGTNGTREASSLYIDINLKKRPASASSVSLMGVPSSGFIRCRSANAMKPGVGVRDAKTDPVKLHQKYANSWAKLNLPGETSHNKLRWAVREWMMGEEPS